jgi:hypothetical protein
VFNAKAITKMKKKVKVLKDSPKVESKENEIQDMFNDSINEFQSKKS